MEPIVIGICGNGPGVGKSTVAEYLRDEYGYTIVKFAGPLKAMMRSLLQEAGYSEGSIWSMVDGDGKDQPLPSEMGGKTPRYLMQTLGTEWGRILVSDEVWVEVALEKIHRALNSGRNVVVDDMRFANELHALLGEVDQFHSLYIRRSGVRVDKGHASEGGIREWHCDWQINNDSSMHELLDGADSIHAAWSYAK